MKNKVFLLVLMLMTAASCRPANLYYVEPSGPPEYQLGWQDGCDTGLSAEGTFLYKLMYGHRKRPEFGTNELYKVAWNEGFAYCRFSIANTMSQDPIWRGGQ